MLYEVFFLYNQYHIELQAYYKVITESSDYAYNDSISREEGAINMRDKVARLVKIVGFIILIITAMYIVSIGIFESFIISPIIILLLISLFIIVCIGGIYLVISIRNKNW